jgi:hypothetical protein
MERENIPNDLKTTISRNLLSTSDKDFFFLAKPGERTDIKGKQRHLNIPGNVYLNVGALAEMNKG